jgi:lipoprotein-anchoring transpeptidase ErfK/SrfK
LTAATRQYEEQNLVSARALATRAMLEEGVAEFDRDWFQAVELISRINTIIMNSEAPAPEKKAYTIRDGDALTRIAYRHNTTVGALQRLNESLSEANATIYPGRVLYYIEGDWHIRVSRSRFVLLLYSGDEIYKMYRVGIGRQNRTPLGIFRIDSKVIHPDWNPPGKNIPYGDPENVLGTHWLGLEPVEGTEPTLRGYGIHGTWEPETVGTAASAGCVRMRNEDVNELFDFIPLPPEEGGGTRVVIED